MELHIKSDFECVYSINGEFFERADSVKMNEYDVVYVTVFPLVHSLLPYTVKLCGTQNVNTELACGVRLNADHYLLSLSPRFIIVYGSHKKPSPPKTPIARLFALLRAGDVSAAYAMLSDELKKSVDKKTLEGFFGGCERLCECEWEHGNKFYLIDKNGAAKLCEYSLKDEFIDDIGECD